MSELELIDRFTDALLRNQNAVPPQGLDPATAEAVRMLVLSEQAKTLDPSLQARVWDHALFQARSSASASSRSKGIEEHVTIVRPREHYQEETDVTLATGYVAARPLQFPDTRRLIFDPITLAVALLAMILLGAALVFMRASAGPGGRPEIEALAEVEPLPVPITADNVDQLQELMVLGRGNILDIAWSPDGNTLALGSSIGIIWLYDLDALDAQPRLLEGHTTVILSLAFSPDGRTLASAGMDNTARLWDVETGEERSVLEIYGVRSIALSPDGGLLAAGTITRIEVWNLQNSEKIAELRGHSADVYRVAFSLDGSVLASASDDHTIRLWDVATGAQLAVLEGHEEAVKSVAFSPNGAMIASTGTDDTVRLWDWNGVTGTRGIVLRSHTGDVWDIAFSPDGNTLASASFDHTIRLWDVRTGESRVLAGHTDIARGIAFSPDGGLLASVSPDETLRLWDVPSGAEVREVSMTRGHESPDGVESIVFSPDNSLLASSGGEDTVRLWDAATGAQLAVLGDHTGVVFEVAFSPDGATLVSGSADRTVRLWDVATGNSRVLEGHTAMVWGVAYGPDGMTVSSSSDNGQVRIWDVATGASRVLEGHQGPIYGVTYSPDGQTIASAGADGTVRLWDEMTGETLAVLQGTRGIGMSFPMFSPDGNLLVAGGLDGTIWLWNVATGAEPVQLHGHEDWVAPWFSPDGALLLTGSGRPRNIQVDASLRLWDVETGEQLRILDTYAYFTQNVSFNQDQTMIAVAVGDGTIRVWGIPPQTLEDGL
jgi:WD40 repeat protein